MEILELKNVITEIKIHCSESIAAQDGRRKS